MGSYGTIIFNVSAVVLRGHSGKHTEEELWKENERIWKEKRRDEGAAYWGEGVHCE